MDIRLRTMEEGSSLNGRIRSLAKRRGAGELGQDLATVVWQRSLLEAGRSVADSANLLRKIVRVVADKKVITPEQYEITEFAGLPLQARIDVVVRFMCVFDGDTLEHEHRAAKRSVEIAAHLNSQQPRPIFTSDHIEMIELGGLLHDVGKIGIPDRILKKPGKLSPEEWETMRRHPILSEQFFDALFITPKEKAQYGIVHDMMLCHHEKWDGTGYPYGLQGEAIPLAARICSVVDVWDALRSDRPYKKAWTEEEARNYLMEQSGKQFDPRVVGALFQVLEKKKREEQVSIRATETGVVLGALGERLNSLAPQAPQFRGSDLLVPAM
ncbi:MAG: HD-GYP domain-containing protein [bacterium]